MRSRVKLGALAGAIIGCLYCAVAIAILVLRALGGGGGPPLSAMANLSRLALFYLVGSTAVGVAIGVLAPLGRNIVGAAVLGATIGVPVTVGLHYVAAGFNPGLAGPLDIRSDLPFSLGMGALMGMAIRIGIRSASKGEPGSI